VFDDASEFLPGLEKCRNGIEEVEYAEERYNNYNGPWKERILEWRLNGGGMHIDFHVRSFG
jgi:hypothetical protein